MNFEENKKQGAGCVATKLGGPECGKPAKFVYTGFNGDKILLCGVHARGFRGPHLVAIDEYGKK